MGSWPKRMTVSYAENGEFRIEHRICYIRMESFILEQTNELCTLI